MAEEANLENWLKRYCADRGIRCLKLGQDGLPDRMLLPPRGHHVRPIFLELKAPGKKASKRQYNNLVDLDERGQLAYCVDSKEKITSIITSFWTDI